MNSGVSSNMWMKPCISRSTSLGMWRVVRVSPCRKIGMSALRKRISTTSCAQVGDGLGRGLGRGELLVVDRQDEGRATALLLREGRQVAVAGDAEHFHALFLDRLGERADPQSRGVLRAEVLVDDDDGEVESHPGRLQRVRAGRVKPAYSPAKIARALPWFKKHKGPSGGPWRTSRVGEAKALRSWAG